MKKVPRLNDFGRGWSEKFHDVEDLLKCSCIIDPEKCELHTHPGHPTMIANTPEMWLAGPGVVQIEKKKIHTSDILKTPRNLQRLWSYTTKMHCVSFEYTSNGTNHPCGGMIKIIEDDRTVCRIDVVALYEVLKKAMELEKSTSCYVQRRKRRIVDSKAGDEIDKEILDSI